MKKKRAAAIGAALMMILAGCGEGGQEQTPAGGNTGEEQNVYLEDLDKVPEELSGEIQEKLTIDASVRKPQKLAYAEYRAEIDQRGESVKEKVEEVFFSEGKVEWVEDEMDGLMALSEDGLVMAQARLYYLNDAYNKYGTIFQQPQDYYLFSQYAEAELDMPEEIQGMQAEEMRRRTEEMAEEFGLAIAAEPESELVLDDAVMQQVMEREKESGMPEEISGAIAEGLKVNEGLFCFSYAGMFEGEKVAYSREEAADHTDGYSTLERGSELSVTWDAKGNLLEFSSMYSYINPERVSEEKPVIGVEEVERILSDKYKNVEFRFAQTVKEINFCYAPVLESPEDYENFTCRMVPVWEVLMVSEPSPIDGIVYGTVLRIHANTGEILLPYQAE